MLKLKAHSGFYELFLKYSLPLEKLIFRRDQPVRDEDHRIVATMSSSYEQRNIYACGQCRTQFMLPNWSRQ
jgi:hypothetical protein